VNSAKDLKKGDRIKITDAGNFWPECKWLQDQIVEVVCVTELDFNGGYIHAKHPKEPILFLRPKDVEKVGE
jgi:hypothetical protein